MKYLKKYESINSKERISNFLKEKLDIHNLIKEFINDYYIYYGDLERNRIEVNSIIGFTILNDRMYLDLLHTGHNGIDIFTISEQNLEKLYSFIDDPDFFRNQKNFNV